MIDQEDKTKFAVFDKTSSFWDSLYKDSVTFSFLAFCIYISQGNTWWTFFTGVTFILWVSVKVAAGMKRHNTFHNVEELQEWVDTLKDPTPKGEK